MRGSASTALVIGMIVIVLAVIGGIFLLNSKTPNTPAIVKPVTNVQDKPTASVDTTDSQIDNDMKDMDTDLGEIDNSLGDKPGDLNQ